MLPKTSNKSALDLIAEKEIKLQIEKQVAIEKAFNSSNVDEIYKAQTYVKDLQKREQVDFKSILVDPMAMNDSFGYREKPYSLSYDVLRSMGRTHIVKAIIETRKEQIIAFCRPQKDKYSTGFVVQKKKKFFFGKEEEKELNKAQQQRIEDIVNFILDCGNVENFWHADSFETFMSKLVTDSLTLDQGTFELVRNRRGELVEFFATDGGTFRIADSYDDDDYTSKEVEYKGYVPSYVQLYQNNVIAEYYPWELCFGIRNPQSNIYANGYGRGELEDMIQTVTAILNADTYNGNFFKVGSAPKGILRYSGNINTNTVEDFKKQWQAQVAGVMNAHKIPTINADKLDFINTHINNKDMEFEKFQEFLIKISCAQYKMDPSEIGFDMKSGSSSPMFEGSNEARLKYSKDKGLRPLLKRVEAWINKYIVTQLDKEYEFKFVGIDVEEEEKEVNLLNTKVQNGMGIKEWREKNGLPRDMEPDDFPLNPVYLQHMQMQQMGNPESDMAMDEEYSDEDNPFIKAVENELPRMLAAT